MYDRFSVRSIYSITAVHGFVGVCRKASGRKLDLEVDAGGLGVVGELAP